MITKAAFYYLYYNNPTELLQTHCGMEEISQGGYEDLIYFNKQSMASSSNSRNSDETTYSYYDNLNHSEIFMGWQCPKVFTADLVTVNMSAKDVLGNKYSSFAKNLAEHYCKDKVLVNVDSDYNATQNHAQSKKKLLNNEESSPLTSIQSSDLHNLKAKTKTNEIYPLEHTLQIYTDYSDLQDPSYSSNSSITSSPIVQNRIKTNGSLPRDKKLFYQDMESSLKDRDKCLTPPPKSYGCENVLPLQQNCVDTVAPNIYSENEHFKIVKQSPRTKIKTNGSTSANKECNINNYICNDTNLENPTTKYEDFMRSFEENFQKEINSIIECSPTVACSKNLLSSYYSPATIKKTNRNINNLRINTNLLICPSNSPTLLKKSAPPPNKVNKTNVLITKSLLNLSANQSSHEQMEKEREDLLQKIQNLKMELSLLQKQDNEALMEMDIENALIIADLQSLTAFKQKLQNEYQLLQQKIHRLEAQRNATRVIEENQQSKLKHIIEMRLDQVEKLKELLKQTPHNTCLKEELSNVKKFLENDKKTFEDLEFQYLEGESEWQSCCYDLSFAQQSINKKIEDCKLSIAVLENLLLKTSYTVTAKQCRLSSHLVSLIKELHRCEKRFKFLEGKFEVKINSNSFITEKNDQHVYTDLRSRAEENDTSFDSTEMLSYKLYNDSLMSKSVNENVLYDNKMELRNSRFTYKSEEKNIDLSNAKLAIFQMNDVIKKLKCQHQLLAAHKALEYLHYKRRKIEGMLKKLNLNVRLQTTVQDRTLENSTSPRLKEKYVADTNSELYSKLSLDSPASAISFYIDDKRSSSMLSNELSYQGDSSTVSFGRKKTQQHKQQRPLTRYMPIFAIDLNLKRHIELAGHPIFLCPHIVLDANSCRGYLHKLGSTFHTWSKRWFVLDHRRNAFIYCTNKSERKPRGGAYFSSIDEVYMDHLNISKSSRFHSTFIVTTKRKSYYLQASSDTAARIWIDVIITGAQGKKHY